MIIIMIKKKYIYKNNNKNNNNNNNNNNNYYYYSDHVHRHLASFCKMPKSLASFENKLTLPLSCGGLCGGVYGVV